jgi:hypothetical protein
MSRAMPRILRALLSLALVGRFNGVEQRVVCGRGAWLRGRLAFYETPFALTVTLRFVGDELLYDSEYNAAFGPTKQPSLVGKAAASR